MKYFEKNITGGCYDQFAMGKWDGKTFWSSNSLYLFDEWIDELTLYTLVFSKVFERYNCWGPNEVTREQWDQMLSLSKEIGGEVEELFRELEPWADENFKDHDVFSILGV